MLNLNKISKVIKLPCKISKLIKHKNFKQIHFNIPKPILSSKPKPQKELFYGNKLKI